MLSTTCKMEDNISIPFREGTLEIKLLKNNKYSVTYKVLCWGQHYFQKIEEFTMDGTKDTYIVDKNKLKQILTQKQLCLLNL